MANPPVSDSIMAPGKMKPLLALSKSEPIQAAFALSTDGEAVILLDKKAKPRAVAAMLKAAAGKAKITLNSSSIRFGRAEVDVDYNPGTVRFFVNKEAPGATRMLLTEVVKRIPYQKVEINVDPSLEEDEDIGGDEEAAAANAAPSGAPVPDPASPAPEAVPDVAALRTQFAGLITKIAAAANSDGTRLAMLKTLAGTVNEHLKAGDAAGASTVLALLQQEIGAAPAPPAASGGPGGGAVRVAKGLLLWNATRTHVDRQLKTLEAAILAQCGDEPDFDEIRANAGSIHEILERLDDGLTEKLNELRGATDAAQKLAIGQAAKQVVARYQRYIGNDALIADIDDNGFTPLDIKPRVTAALDAVLQVL